ncbi:pre-peptidase C-terminal domain-containing protein [Okeania sp. SIO1F9]|uniref:pre-peptidase C-terminal domain-containing protein n=1 Tax=Okeania sp. SIO1F9 TaxID=2607813 RepID=UPI00257CDA49|nr:pre-peptidase C-terminal domain-containing protein [Okeania sp. SIO1F9]
MRQARFWAIAPFGLLSIMGKTLLFPILLFHPVVINSSYANEILVQDTPTPEETTPTPEETTPNPEETTPNPEETTPNPEETTPNPEETTPNPEETTPNPEETTPNPEETTPNPEETTPTPEETTPNPEETTPNPEETTPNPEETTPSTQEQKVGKEILQLEGTLSDGDLVLPSDESIYDEHTFEGTTGQVVTVILESPDFDTYLAVFSPTGELLGEHDDVSQKNTNSQLTITLTVTGKYRVIVNSYDKTGRGQYNLQVIESGQTSDL